MIVEAPADYETKVKVYLGKGNNSNLILGLIKRRPWYQITDKYQEANFVWTQIKVPAYFNLQKKSEKKVEFQ
jgi:tubulin polyglutamylase TTLL1